MYTLSLCCAFAATVSGLLLLPLNLFAAPAKETANSAALQASAAASLAWLSLVDKGNYPKSWSDASSVMKLTVPQDEWVQILNKTRKPLGSVKTRQVLDQRTAKDPHGLPKGDYIVMFYKTDFSSKADAHELVTLYLEDGAWGVLTYQVD